MEGRAHLFVACVSLAAVFFILRLVRARQVRAKYAFLWISVGAAMVLLAAAPSILDTTATWLGIAYPPAVLFVLALGLLLLVVIHFSWELSRLEERTRTLAEELALLHAKRQWETDGPS
jgi:hypothetical protein